MKTCKICGVPKTLDSFHKNSIVKDGLDARCKSCCKALKAAAYIANRDKFLARDKAYREANPAKNKARIARWQRENRDKVRAKSKRYYARKAKHENARNLEWRKLNPEKEALRQKRYAENNRDLLAALAAKYRATKIRATPAWANFAEVNKLYEAAYWLSVATGVQHHVDHIVPLQSDIVCGLHWEGNLQVLPKLDNLIKGNRRWPDMP